MDKRFTRYPNLRLLSAPRTGDAGDNADNQRPPTNFGRFAAVLRFLAGRDGARARPRNGLGALSRPDEYHVPDLPATKWGTCSCGKSSCGVCEPTSRLQTARPDGRNWLWLAVYLFGAVTGHMSAGLKHIADGLRLESLEKAQELCDTEVLRCEVQRQRDNEAYFRECTK